MIRWLMSRMHEPVYRARLAELVRQIGPHLRAGDRVLDVGCGFGALGRALMDDRATPDNLEVRGLEPAPREGELIPVTAYDGGRIPFEDGSFDVVILADVLHHEPEPDGLIDECRRVTRRLLIIKDHKIDGPLAKPRISLIDWAANAPYGVPCLFRYLTPSQWHECFEQHQLKPLTLIESMNLYPPGYNILFGRRLHILVFLEPAPAHQSP